MATAKWVGLSLCVALATMMLSGCVQQSALDQANRDLAATEAEAARMTEQLALARTELAEIKVLLARTQTDLAAANKAREEQATDFSTRMQAKQTEMDTISAKVQQLDSALKTAEQRAIEVRKSAADLEIALDKASAAATEKDGMITRLGAENAALEAKLKEAQQPVAAPTTTTNGSDAK